MTHTERQLNSAELLEVYNNPDLAAKVLVRCVVACAADTGR